MFVESLFLILYEATSDFRKGSVLGCLMADWMHFGWLDVVKCLSRGFFANFGWRISMGSGNCHFLLGKNRCHSEGVVFVC
jgi:hypothetical protein